MSAQSRQREDHSYSVTQRVAEPETIGKHERKRASPKEKDARAYLSSVGALFVLGVSFLAWAVRVGERACDLGSGREAARPIPRPALAPRSSDAVLPSAAAQFPAEQDLADCSRQLAPSLGFSATRLRLAARDGGGAEGASERRRSQDALSLAEEAAEQLLPAGDDAAAAAHEARGPHGAHLAAVCLFTIIRAWRACGGQPPPSSPT